MSLSPVAAALALSEYFAMEAFHVHEAVMELGPETFLGLPDKELLSIFQGNATKRWLEDRSTFHPGPHEEAVKEAGVQVIGITDETYPERLRDLPDPPLALFVKGTMPTAEKLLLAVVGTRHPDGYGERLAKEVSKPLAKAGVAIVSGGAMGVDEIAHEATVKEGGYTLAVLGQGVLFHASGRQNKLFENILAGGGGILSEYSPFTSPEPFRFPYRNRLISGLSHGVVVIQARSKSGTKITARHALEQGRDVFVLPGDVFNPNSQGCHELIRDGATLVRSALDILQDMRYIGLEEVPPDESAPPTHLAGHKRTVYACLDRSGRTVDELCALSGLSAQIVNSALLMLEMEQLAAQPYQGKFVREAAELPAG